MMPADQPQTNDQEQVVVAAALRHRDAIVAVILAMVRDFDLAEDLLQETMIEILRSSERFDPQEELLPWFKGIARNMVHRHWRRQQRESKRLAIIGDLEFLAGVIDKQPEPRWEAERAALRHCLQQVGERGRRLLQLRYEQGLHGDALAAAAGMAFTSLANTYLRLRSKLRRCISARLVDGAEKGVR